MLKNQPGQGVMLSSYSNDRVSAYYDVDWESYHQTKRSKTFSFVKIGKSIISWKSLKQTNVSKSSAEVEFRSLAGVTTELTCILGLMKKVGSKVLLLVDVFCDIKSTLQIAAKPIYHERTLVASLSGKKFSSDN